MRSDASWAKKKLNFQFTECHLLDYQRPMPRVVVQFENCSFCRRAFDPNSFARMMFSYRLHGIVRVCGLREIRYVDPAISEVA